MAANLPSESWLNKTDYVQAVEVKKNIWNTSGTATASETTAAGKDFTLMSDAGSRGVCETSSSPMASAASSFDVSPCSDAAKQRTGGQWAEVLAREQHSAFFFSNSLAWLSGGLINISEQASEPTSAFHWNGIPLYPCPYPLRSHPILTAWYWYWFLVILSVFECVLESFYRICTQKKGYKLEAFWINFKWEIVS